jgi:hypothetical protein
MNHIWQERKKINCSLMLINASFYVKVGYNYRENEEIEVDL